MLKLPFSTGENGPGALHIDYVSRNTTRCSQSRPKTNFLSLVCVFLFFVGNFLGHFFQTLGPWRDDE